MTAPVTPQKPVIKHATAGAIILTDTKPAKVLLVHHRKSDTWLQPGGHQESWENPLETTIREIREETGLNIAPYLPAVSPIDEKAAHLPQPKYLLEEKIRAHGNDPAHYHLDHLYVVRIPEQPPTHNADESHGIGWFNLQQIQELPMYDNTRQLLTQELQA